MHVFLKSSQSLHHRLCINRSLGDWLPDCLVSPGVDLYVHVQDPPMTARHDDRSVRLLQSLQPPTLLFRALVSSTAHLVCSFGAPLVLPGQRDACRGTELGNDTPVSRLLLHAIEENPHQCFAAKTIGHLSPSTAVLSNAQLTFSGVLTSSPFLAFLRLPERGSTGWACRFILDLPFITESVFLDKIKEYPPDVCRIGNRPSSPCNGSTGCFRYLPSY